MNSKHRVSMYLEHLFSFSYPPPKNFHIIIRIDFDIELGNKGTAHTVPTSRRVYAPKYAQF